MKRPVTIVTGFLGSGKTTLLSRLLSEADTQDVAVLVNEFGEVGLDHHLLRRVNERTVLLGSGCVCCSRREDLVESLLELLALESRGQIPRLGRVVVETTGLADPAPILFTVFEHPVLCHHFGIDAVVTTVDAVNGHLHLDANPESTGQITAADRLVVTKQDLAAKNDVEALVLRLRAINPTAGFADPDAPDLLSAPGVGTRNPAPPAGVAHGGETSATDSVSLTFDGPVDWAAFGVWLSMLLNARGEEVLRVKGMLDVGEAGPVILNGVQHTIHPPRHLDGWPEKDRTSRLVFITRGLEAQEVLRSLGSFSKLLGASPRPLPAPRL
ncbi:CobW family GTP-binding protein [Rubrobacter indicoceani]|uniref:CobW family GTP-binding protein n=1 Tax=Rubrobacter indicoceani TaxID=2051957 RepID=UPI000E5AB48E|nr:GTP-binding protein [Rubrobacter indicoceani]